MKQGRSTGSPTTAQRARFDAIRDVGCIACLILGMATPAEVHHLTIGGKHGQKRLGHDHTIGLCSYHHRGSIPGCALPARLLEERYGPSYALAPRAFRGKFGQDDYLLHYQNERIAALGIGSML